MAIERIETTIIGGGPRYRVPDFREWLSQSRSAPTRRCPGGRGGRLGCQIAEELLRGGRTVCLSVGPHRRVPRRYRGRDIIWWITELGLDEAVADEHATRQAPLLISGADGGHTVDLRGFAGAGMMLVGRLQDARDGIVSFVSDLAGNLAAGDESYAAFMRTADAHVVRNGLTLPEKAGDLARAESASDPVLTLDLRAAGIEWVIWATGYRYDFDWINLDVFAGTGDPQGRTPVHRRGVTNVPGVYVLGLPFLHKTKSSFLSGVGEDAAYLAERIVARDRRTV